MRTKKTMSMFEIYIRFQPIGSAAFFQVSKKKYNQRSAAVVLGVYVLYTLLFSFFHVPAGALFLDIIIYGDMLIRRLIDHENFNICREDLNSHNNSRGTSVEDARDVDAKNQVPKRSF